jgi:P27 family predicted phage terminase small subunit
MAKAKRPTPPKGLGAPGKALWKSILADLDAGWALDQRELHWLERACRCQDELADLEAAVDADGPIATGSHGQTVVHPALAEARQLRLVQLRLLSAIETVDPKASPRPATPAQSQASRAAAARWADHPKGGRSRG